MNLPLFIARRYLFARKSHNVINIISAISATGMATGTAALVLILSVYNGFDSLIRSSLSDLDPDILITPAEGKVWTPDGQWLDELASRDGVTSVCTSLTDNVFIDYGGQQAVAVAKGVDQVWELVNPLSSHTGGAQFTLHDGGEALCACGAALARQLGVSTSFLSPMTLYYPRRDAQISMANPAASLTSVRLRPATIFSVSTDADATLVILPMVQMRQLLGYGSECTAVEVRCTAAAAKGLIRELKDSLGGELTVKGHVEQNAALYKMMRYEKAAIFLILLFVVIIIAFNIFGSLTMLIIEKEGDIGTLRSMGATDSLLRRIFVLEGWMISLLGLAVGLIVGLALAALQQHFGMVRMPGGYTGAAYPVVIKASDIAAVAAGVALVGYVIALLPTGKLHSHTDLSK